jgi:TPR repeat protein
MLAAPSSARRNMTYLLRASCAALLSFCALAVQAQDAYESGLQAFRSADYAAAIAHWEPLAEKGDSRAQLALAALYERGQGVPRDPRRAFQWYQKAAASGLPEALHDLGVKYYGGSGVERNVTEAARLWKQAAEKGLTPAKTKLGFLYYRGEGIERDPQKAVQWYSQAATAGDPEAQYNLGLMYARGDAVARNYATAAEWMGKSADAGYARAQTDYALLYLSGQGVKQDTAIAEQYLRRAAAQDQGDALYYLALLYIHGQGVAQDREQGMKLLERAAAKGVPQAKLELGEMRRAQAPSATPVAAAKPAQSNPAGTGMPKAAAQAAASPPATVPEPPPAAPKPAPPATATEAVVGGLLNDWLLAQPAGQYTLQLFASSDEQIMRRFVAGLKLPAPAGYYSYPAKGQTWYAAISGQFASIASAREALDALPEAVRKHSPMVRNLGILQKRVRGETLG